jgi:hypothetical protein
MALATGKTLGKLARALRPSARICIGALIIALVLANTLNIAADLVATGSGTQLLRSWPCARRPLSGLPARTDNSTWL